MKILNIQVKNFKSFADLDINFNDLNVFIGANASGKSSFIKVFDFLRNISEHGLDNAISMEGGVEYLRNTQIKASQNLEIEITYKPDGPNFVHEADSHGLIGVKTSHVEYGFEIRFHKRGGGFSIIHDRLVMHYEFVKLNVEDESAEEGKSLGSGRGELFTNSKRVMKSNVHIPEGLSLSSDEIFIPQIFPKISDLKKHVLLLETPYFEIIHRLSSPFESLAIYDFDTKLPKKATSFTGLKELEENGSNLSLVLKNITENKESKRKFLNLLNDLLPFVTDFKVQRFADKSILFAMSEEFASAETYLPASFISDGTVSILALLAALYFEDKAPVILEEPERNIHPHLISNLINMFDDVSKVKQLIITTHNPEIVRYTKLDNLFLIRRDLDGYSEICRPVESNEIHTFLENEIGIEELYIQDLLGVVDVR